MTTASVPPWPDVQPVMCFEQRVKISGERKGCSIIHGTIITS